MAGTEVRGLLEMMFGRLQTGQMRALGVIKSDGRGSAFFWSRGLYVE